MLRKSKYDRQSFNQYQCVVEDEIEELVRQRDEAVRKTDRLGIRYTCAFLIGFVTASVIAAII